MTPSTLTRLRQRRRKTTLLERRSNTNPRDNIRDGYARRDLMNRYRLAMLVFILAAASLNATSTADTGVDPASAMRWRQIGPTRAGRARAVAGVGSQPNVAYIGFDNGGVWRSTDYGSNWEPLFDH